MSAEDVPVFAGALTIEPGKTYVIETPRHITAEEAQEIRDRWLRMAPESRVIILSGGLTLARAKTAEVSA